jgi:hypothetical protein
MLPAFPGGERPVSAASRLEEAIRTLSVSLVALAAMMVSVSVARQRSEPRREDLQPRSTRVLTPGIVDLEAIRTAGF